MVRIFSLEQRYPAPPGVLRVFLGVISMLLCTRGHVVTMATITFIFISYKRSISL